MKRIINISLHIILFLLVTGICIISIKKFFDIKYVKKLDNIIASNYISSFVGFNKLEESLEVIVIDDDVNDNIVDEKENLSQSIIEEEIILEEKNENTVIDKPTEEIVGSENSLILFDGLTENDLVNKLEKNLKNELSGTAVNFVNYYKDYGLDPYLAVSIVLHETGCTWTCSSLVRECYNYGGMKGGTSKYKDTNYSCYASKEDGINAYLNMLYNNYYAKGLNTPELINPKYAASLEWAAAINRYIDKIKNS